MHLFVRIFFHLMVYAFANQHQSQTKQIIIKQTLTAAITNTIMDTIRIRYN